MGNRRFTLEKIRTCLRESGSNLVFLQEVSGENLRRKESIADWPDQNQFEFLADSVWDHYAYGKNAIYQHGHHGNAILSELPIKSWDNIDISTLDFSQRGILHGILENDIHLLCVHFGLFEKERRQQTRTLLDYIENNIDAAAPLILAGDFNDWRKVSHRNLQNKFGLKEAGLQHNKKLAETFPAVFPFLPMDRIYTRGFSICSVEIMTHPRWRSLSDHCAIATELLMD